MIRILAIIQEFVPTRSFLRIITHAPALIRMLDDFAMSELILAVRIHAKMAVCAVMKTVVRIITVVVAIIRILEDYVKFEKILAIRIHVKITGPAMKKTTVPGTDVNA